MKKVIRLTEADLTRIVRRVINEQDSMRVEQILMSCYPGKLHREPESGEDFLPKNMFLEGLMEATNYFNDSSNWDEEGFLFEIESAIANGRRKEIETTQKLLQCAWNKLGMSTKLQDNNPLLTLARMMFTTTIMGRPMTDLGDSENKERAQYALSKLGIKTKI